MIRIGFDPSLDAEIQHQDLIREVEQLRIAQSGSENTQPGLSVTARILALLGRQMVSLGSQLEERYNISVDDCMAVNTLYSDDPCIS